MGEQHEFDQEGHPTQSRAVLPDTSSDEHESDQEGHPTPSRAVLPDTSSDEHESDQEGHPTPSRAVLPDTSSDEFRAVHSGYLYPMLCHRAGPSIRGSLHFLAPCSSEQCTQGTRGTPSCATGLVECELTPNLTQSVSIPARIRPGGTSHTEQSSPSRHLIRRTRIRPGGTSHTEQSTPSRHLIRRTRIRPGGTSHTEQSTPSRHLIRRSCFMLLDLWHLFRTSSRSFCLDCRCGSHQ
ncbi:uncharacterized protein LOC135373339 [Ornithodoros turicata]|uniref:uncharacterized protein LOC135373339 n=1 Tax=Ornithodoros turicata TaxID=34597 RepID=UPI00313A277A